MTQVRAGQAALALSDCHMIDQDSYALNADDTHFGGLSLVELGHDYAAKVLEGVP